MNVYYFHGKEVNTVGILIHSQKKCWIQQDLWKISSLGLHFSRIRNSLFLKILLITMPHCIPKWIIFIENNWSSPYSFSRLKKSVQFDWSRFWRIRNNLTESLKNILQKASSLVNFSSKYQFLLLHLKIGRIILFLRTTHYTFLYLPNQYVPKKKNFKEMKNGWILK